MRCYFQTAAVWLLTKAILFMSLSPVVEFYILNYVTPHHLFQCKENTMLSRGVLSITYCLQTESNNKSKKNVIFIGLLSIPNLEQISELWKFPLPFLFLSELSYLPSLYRDHYVISPSSFFTTAPVLCISTVLIYGKIKSVHL